MRPERPARSGHVRLPFSRTHPHAVPRLRRTIAARTAVTGALLAWATVPVASTAIITIPDPGGAYGPGPCHFDDYPSPGDHGRRHARLADHPHRGRRRPGRRHRHHAPGPHTGPVAGPPSPDDTRWPVPGTSHAWILATVQARSLRQPATRQPPPVVARRQKPRSASLKKQTPKGDQSRISAAVCAFRDVLCRSA